jgi:hypothetical protein
MSKLSIQSALITAVAIAGFAVGRSWPAAAADDRAYYVKAIESSLARFRRAVAVVQPNRMAPVLW